MKPIYQPKGAAKEYGDYAINIYTGCPHRCFYCFAPNVLHRDRQQFHEVVEPRKGIVEETRRQIECEGITGKLIHLCFTCDPYCSVHPTTIADFTELPFPDNSFYHVVFDPPHLLNVSETAWLAKKYGKLYDGWETMISKGFQECMRVLKPNGTLIFKWSETDIPLKKILQIIGRQPLYGHKSGKRMQTHWLCFMKEELL